MPVKGTLKRKYIYICSGKSIATAIYKEVCIKGNEGKDKKPSESPQ